MTNHNSQTTITKVLETLADFHEYNGADYLLELITHPNEPIHASELRHLYAMPVINRPEYKISESNLSNKTSFNQSLKNPFDETSIKYCDQKTIDQIKHRLSKLIEQKAIAQEWNDLARLEDIISEEEKLIEYLKKAFNNKGNPRYLRNKTVNDYLSIKKSLNRVISKIQSKDPDVADIIKQHLKTGIMFEWRFSKFLT